MPFGPLATAGGGGGGGAPTDAQYVVLVANATLTQERVLTGSANEIVITDGGAGAAVTLTAGTLIVQTDQANTWTTGVQTINTGAAGTIGLIVKGNAGQTANILEVQDSASAISMAVQPSYTLINGQLGIAFVSPAVPTSTVDLRGVLGFLTVPKPAANITTALILGAGNVDIGLHRYAYTYVTAYGETDLEIFATATTDAANRQVALSDILTGASDVTARKVYRTKVGVTGTYYLLTTVADNTTTTYTDNTADAALGASTGSARDNTTAGVILVDSTQVGFAGDLNTSFGKGALESLTAGQSNSAFGHQAGQALTSATFATLLGRNAGLRITTGGNIVAIGYNALSSITTNGDAIAIGSRTLEVATGPYNIAIGSNAGIGLTTGQSNVAIGRLAMGTTTSASNNTVVGYLAGRNIGAGAGNVMLGYQAGTNENGSNTLYIANSNTATPLIYGLFTGAGAGVTIHSQNTAGVPLIVKGAAAQTANLLELQESDGSIFVASGDGLAGSEFVINEQGENIDFRVESATYNAILVDADQDELELMSNAAGKIGMFAVNPVVQAAHIADPAGGGVVDAEARTAIDAILVAIENIGITASA